MTKVTIATTTILIPHIQIPASSNILIAIIGIMTTAITGSATTDTTMIAATIQM